MRPQYPKSVVRHIGHESEVAVNSSKLEDSAGPGEALVAELMRFRPDGMSANGWAVAAGVSRTIWWDLRRHGNPSRRTLAKLLGAAGSSLAEFEALRCDPGAGAVDVEPRNIEVGQTRDRQWGWRGPAMAPIPVIGCRDGGHWRDGSLSCWVIDPASIQGQVPRPPSLATDPSAFALIPSGNAMTPRFRCDRPIVLSPAASASLGAEVLVRLAGDADEEPYVALPGVLLGFERGAIRLAQPRPGAESQIERPLVRSILVIVGELI